MLSSSKPFQFVSSHYYTQVCITLLVELLRVRASYFLRKFIKISVFKLSRRQNLLNFRTAGVKKGEKMYKSGKELVVFSSFLFIFLTALQCWCDAHATPNDLGSLDYNQLHEWVHNAIKYLEKGERGTAKKIRQVFFIAFDL